MGQTVKHVRPQERAIGCVCVYAHVRVCVFLCMCVSCVPASCMRDYGWCSEFRCGSRPVSVASPAT